MAASRKPRAHPFEEDLKARALIAYRRGARPGESIARLDALRADVVEVAGRWYVTLATGGGLVCVFRVKTDDKLRRLTMARLPKELRPDDDE